jgi:predicted cupin superfamily sugar epimerase
MTPHPLVDRLGLRPHPEGGYYKEVFRSGATVRPDDDRPARAAVTTIYYLLVAGEHSGWHTVRSDEIWHFYDGDPLDLFIVPPSCDRLERIVLGPPTGTTVPTYTVPANWWQAARPRGAYTLAGATVAPGFENADFTMARNVPNVRTALERVDETAAALF